MNQFPRQLMHSVMSYRRIHLLIHHRTLRCLLLLPRGASCYNFFSNLLGHQRRDFSSDVENHCQYLKIAQREFT